MASPDETRWENPDPRAQTHGLSVSRIAPVDGILIAFRLAARLNKLTPFAGVLSADRIGDRLSEPNL